MSTTSTSARDVCYGTTLEGSERDTTTGCTIIEERPSKHSVDEKRGPTIVATVPKPTISQTHTTGIVNMSTTSVKAMV